MSRQQWPLEAALNFTCLLCYTVSVILLLWLAIPINEASDISKYLHGWPVVDSTFTWYSEVTADYYQKCIQQRELSKRKVPYTEHDIVFKHIICISLTWQHNYPLQGCIRLGPPHPLEIGDNIHIWWHISMLNVSFLRLVQIIGLEGIVRTRQIQGPSDTLYEARHSVCTWPLQRSSSSTYPHPSPLWLSGKYAALVHPLYTSIQGSCILAIVGWKRTPHS